MIYSLGDRTPEFKGDYFIADGAVVIGSVVLENNASIWFNAVIRGDNDVITIGENSNIQDGSVLHTDGGIPLNVGKNVTVGHKVMLHGCEIQDRAFVGMSAVIMDTCVVETGAMVAAGAFLPPGKIARKGELWAGWPAKPIRAMTDAEAAMVANGPANYAELAAEYRKLQG